MLTFLHPLRRISPVLLLALAACASPSGIEPQATLTSPESLGLSAHTVQDQPLLAPDWWTQWNDPQLNALIEQALRDSPALHVALARVRRAQAQTLAAQAQRAPQSQAQAEAMRQHYTATGLVPAPVAGSVRETGTLQLGSSWDLDLFGRQRAALDAAIGAQRAAQADAQAARVLLSTQLVRYYIALAHLQAQHDVVQRTFDQREEMLALVRARLQAGLDTELELRQSEGLLPQSRQQALALQEQIDLTRNAMATLAANPALAASIQVPALETLKTLDLPQTLPLNLLGHRADIAAARWRVEATQSNISEARARFYPNINLTAFFGLSSLGLDRLLLGESRQWGLGPAISLPLFDAGRLRANLQAHTADYDEAAEQYNKLVLDAVHEVTDALVSLRSITAQQQEQAFALSAAEHAWRIAQARYGAGLANYLQVLASETAVLQQRLQSTDLTARALDVHAQLAQALGGGYQADGAALSPDASAAQ